MFVFVLFCYVCFALCFQEKILIHTDYFLFTGAPTLIVFVTLGFGLGFNKYAQDGQK